MSLLRAFVTYLSRPKLRLGLWGLFLGLLLVPEMVFASQQVAAGFGAILSLIVECITFFVVLFLDLAGPLMGSEHITGAHMMQTIRPLWVFVRNMVNVLLVVVLLYIVAYNLFTFGQGGNWTIKDKLPRFIMTLVLINFSLLGMRVAIDAVNVATYSVLTMPHYAISEPKAVEDWIGETCTDEMEKAKKCEKGQSFRDKVNAHACESGSADTSPCFFQIEADPNVANLTVGPERAIFFAFGVYILQIQELMTLPENLESLSDVLNNTLFSLVMAIAYAIVLAGLFVALVARTIVLWLMIIISPVLIGAKLMGIGYLDFVWDMFINHLFIPLKIALALGMSFLMIMALIPFQMDDSIIRLGPSLQTFGHTGYDMLWQIATVAIFWGTAKWALDNTVAKAAVDGITGFGESLGKMALSGVANAPIIPTGTANQGMGVSQLFQIPRRIQDRFEGGGTDGLAEFMKNTFGTDDGQVASLTHAIRNSAISDRNNVRSLRQALGRLETASRNQLASGSMAEDHLRVMYQSMNQDTWRNLSQNTSYSGRVRSEDEFVAAMRGTKGDFRQKVIEQATGLGASEYSSGAAVTPTQSTTGQTPPANPNPSTSTSAPVANAVNINIGNLQSQITGVNRDITNAGQQTALERELRNAIDLIDATKVTERANKEQIIDKIVQAIGNAYTDEAALRAYLDTLDYSTF